MNRIELLLVCFNELLFYSRYDSDPEPKYSNY